MAWKAIFLLAKLKRVHWELFPGMAGFHPMQAEARRNEGIFWL